MEQIELNILMSYPVYWSERKVLRDYIQNFFDALGPKKFKKEFHYSYAGQTLKMWSNTIFEKQWLFYMGASTKRNTNNNYAGKYGEGFKIASLVAYRDLKLKITMESKEWRIRVSDKETYIDEKAVRSLVYNVDKRKYKSNSILTLEGVSEELYKIFLQEIDNFYYEGNPKFGKCIAKNEDYAVYHSAEDMQSKKGAVYVAYQNRNSLPVPIYICNHTYEVYQDDDRDRDKMTTSDTTICMCNAFRKMTAKQAAEVLIIFQRYWSGKEFTKFPSFRSTYIIDDLIYVICQDKKCKNDFFEKYKTELVADFSTGTNREKKRMAWNWYRYSEFYNTRKVVASTFQQFGIKDIAELCEENNGYEITRRPNELEEKYLGMLELMAREIFSTIIVYEKLPDCNIILKNRAPIDGRASTRKMDQLPKNELGVKVAYRISTIAINESILHTGSFETAVTTYMHELLHQYGGDTSIKFRNMLLEMNYIILENIEVLKDYKERWENIA